MLISDITAEYKNMLPVRVVFQVLQWYPNFSIFDTFFRRGNIFFYYVLLCRRTS